jgi:hypothetical protein
VFLLHFGRDGQRILDAASVYVPHPLQNKTTAELHAWADEAIEEILAAICLKSSDVVA